MPANIWVYIDQFQGEALSASWETLGAACELGTGLQSKVVALVFGVNAAAIAGEALARGATATTLDCKPVPSSQAAPSVSQLAESASP